jgi:hypothetical protein
MPISMMDQMLFDLCCGHQVVLGRLVDAKNWTCEGCQKTTDLSSGPYKAALDKDLDTANQIDLQVKAKGKTVTRLDG